MARSRVPSTKFDRRSVVLAGAALVGMATWPKAATSEPKAEPKPATPAPKTAVADPGLGSTAELSAATRKWLALLDGNAQKSALFAWNGSEWRNWNYFGVTGYIKPGLRIEQMDPATKAAGWDLLGKIWSPAGLNKAKNVMLLQDILAAGGNGAGQRSSERFSLSVFGKPAGTGTWGLRFEGHHLTHSVTVRDNRIVSVTPHSFSSLPNRVTSGAHAGLVTLKDEEGLARRLFADLTPKLQARAKLGDRSPSNILSFAGRERSNSEKVGVAIAELSTAQRDLLWQLIEIYAVDHMPAALATAQRARLRSGDQAAVHFAWYGPNTPEKQFGYRLIGDSFVIEMASVDAEAQHLHTIYNDLGNVLGRTG